MKRAVFTFCCLLFFVGCHHRPVADLTLADVAIKAAQKVKADALAPDTYRKAENYYLRAKKDYAEGYFDSCKNFSNQARLLAEQAEFKALKKQLQMKNLPGADDGSGAPSPNNGPPDMGGANGPPPGGDGSFPPSGGGDPTGGGGLGSPDPGAGGGAPPPPEGPQ